MAHMGFTVLGIDSSLEGVSFSKKNALSTNTYKVMNVGNLDLNVINDFIGNDESIYIYSRFFQHSLTEEEESAMFSAINNLTVKNIKMFFEFRNDKDERNGKVFGGHFRRFQSEISFINKLESFGFLIKYKISGHGFAKYRDEDPEITRVICEKNS
jgi:hypothetical protein